MCLLPPFACPQRNYRTFLLFIYGTSVYIAWTFGVSLGSLFVKHAELEAAAAARPQDNSNEGLSSNLWLQTLSKYSPAAGVWIAIVHACMRTGLGLQPLKSLGLAYRKVRRPVPQQH